MSKEWRCFHCDEVFTDSAAAEEHFGASMCDDPACQIDMTDVRAMENQLRQYRNEDTELHRQIHSMQADHAVALRREEENGYAKGLRDLRPVCEALRELVSEIEDSGTRAFELDTAHAALSAAGYSEVEHG